MKKIIITLIFQLSVLFFLYGQESITGTVLNKETNTPIANVNIHINGTSIGTISNSDGVFILTIHKEHKYKTLLFSFLGFETQEWKIGELQVQNNIIIALNHSIVTLDEVIISSKNKLDGSQIIENAFDNYAETFSTTPYIAKGFVRHTEKTDKEYKWLVESAFEMYEPGYTQRSNVKINIIETRKSLDNRVIDTVSVILAYLHDSNNYRFNKNYKIAKNYRNMSSTDLNKSFSFCISVISHIL